VSGDPHPVPDVAELRGRLVGRELPEGSYLVPAYAAWLTEDVLRSPPLAAGTLHPMFVFYASVGGGGYTIADLFDLAECATEDGPMIGEMDLRQRRALRVGESLTVTSRITDVARKHGRSGTFDTMTVATTLAGADGEAASVRNTFIFPRRS
jgi:hypothetical protein